jgi:hypothetical protein
MGPGFYRMFKQIKLTLAKFITGIEKLTVLYLSGFLQLELIISKKSIRVYQFSEKCAQKVS